MKIAVVRTEEEIARAKAMIREYADSLGCSPCLKNIEKEMRSFPLPFAGPDGALILAQEEGQGAGVVGVKRLTGDVAEMARLYVAPSFRGRKLGKELVRLSIGLAREMGYTSIRLHTLPDMVEALCLYQQLGFQGIEPYGDHPIPGAVYLEKKFADSDG